MRNPSKQFAALLILSCLLRSDGGSSLAGDDGGRYVTLAVKHPGDVEELSIPEGEVAQLVSAYVNGNFEGLEINRDGFTWPWSQDYAGPGVVKDPIIIAGPATFRLKNGGSFCTFKISPNAVDPRTTVVVPPGAAGGKIQLQASTNLTDWFSVDPGPYTNLPAAYFFRVDLERQPPQKQ